MSLRELVLFEVGTDTLLESPPHLVAAIFSGWQDTCRQGADVMRQQPAMAGRQGSGGGPEACRPAVRLLCPHSFSFCCLAAHERLRPDVHTGPRDSLHCSWGSRSQYKICGKAMQVSCDMLRHVTDHEAVKSEVQVTQTKIALPMSRMAGICVT